MSDKPKGAEKLKLMRRIKPHDADDDNPVKASKKARDIQGIILAYTKPSYCLKRGIGNLHRDRESLRNQHRKKLRRLLNKLLRQQNWVEASGVLSVLLKGTAKEKSISRNRRKYWATLELLQRIKGDNVNKRRMQNVYELWMKKLGPIKKWPTKDRFAAQWEFILFCLTHGNTEDAHQGALGLMQERGFASDAVSNLIVGLTFIQLWYSTIPEEMQLGELNKSGTPMQSEISEDRICMSIENSGGHDAIEAQVTNFSMKCDSNTSVGNEKDDSRSNFDQHGEVLMGVDDNPCGETSHYSFQAQDFYMKSFESSGDEGPFSFHTDEIPRTSIFYTHGLPPWLLPLQLPHSTENLENFIYMHRNSLNDYYNNALEYLRAALYSEPPAFEAFHPLIQMLLLGDHVEEALDEVERFSCNLDTALQLRLKTSLSEHFNNGNGAKLSTQTEDILRRDPTCSRSLSKLINVHRSGYYTTEKLVEMIACHLDAMVGDCNAWKEFASCFLKLSQGEGDQTSVCFDRDDDGEKQKQPYSVPQLPGIFSNTESQCTWRLRCKWWQKRHYSQKILGSETAKGDLQLVTYKAAAASHLYGREFVYVVKASEHLNREKEVDLLSILRTHIQNSVGFYFSLDRKS